MLFHIITVINSRAYNCLQFPLIKFTILIFTAFYVAYNSIPRYFTLITYTLYIHLSLLVIIIFFKPIIYFIKVYEIMSIFLIFFSP